MYHGSVTGAVGTGREWPEQAMLRSETEDKIHVRALMAYVYNIIIYT